jgi:multidrug resistance efflux pump
MPGLFKHTYILSALGAVAVIAVVSGIYFYAETRTPAPVSLPDTNAAGAISASGDIEPLENPDLSFAASGRIAYVGVAAGDRVYTGETLASLDVAALSAQKDQAIADEKAQQARLDELKSPARSTDIAIRQNAVSEASQTRAATYAGLPSLLSDAYAKSSDAVHVQTDAVFSNPNSSNPSVSFASSQSTAVNAAVLARITVGAELTAWNDALKNLPASPSQNDLDQALDAALAHLAVVRSFEDSVLTALNAAIPTTSFPSSSIVSAQASVSTARTTVNGLITSLTSTKQMLVTEALAIQSAQAQLDQLNAGASVQDIAAQEAAVERAHASVAAIQAQISNNVVSAPFSGVVGSVSIKKGELATPNTPIITLIPDSGLETVVYVSERDIARIEQGDTAEVTLDAYGAQIFSAHVSSVDTAPSSVSGGSQMGYKVRLTFDKADARIKTGMTANATITPSAQ